MPLRIAVCAKRDLLGAIALNELLPQIASHQIGLFYSNKTRPVERAVPELAMEALLERDLPLDILFPLMEHLPRASRMATLSELAAEFACEEHVLADLKPQGGARHLASFAPDLVISVRFSLIFKRPTIEMPRFGIINIHPGPLPGYRGLFAPFWQMANGEDRLGVTTHFVDEGIDTGPILGVDWIPVGAGRSVFWHLPQLYSAGIRRAVAAAAQAASGGAIVAQAQPRQGNYYTFPAGADIDRLRAAGRELVLAQDYCDWLRRMAGLDDATVRPAILREATSGA